MYLVKRFISNDLNFSDAMAAIFNFINRVNKRKNHLNQANILECREFMIEIDKVLGIIKPLYQEYCEKLNRLKDNSIEQILEKRVLAKKNSDYCEADKLRKELETTGLQVVDSQFHESYCELKDIWN